MKLTFRPYLTLLLFLAFCSSVIAQIPQKQEKIEPGELVFEYVQIQGENSRTFGTIYERIHYVGDVGTISFTQEMPGSTLMDSIFIYTGNWKPIRYHSIAPNMQDITIHYEIPGETEVHIKRNIPGNKIDTSYTASTNQNIYDLHWPHLLIGALQPLEKKDDVVNLSTFNYQHQKQIQPVSYKGTSTTELNGKTYVTYNWESEDPVSGTQFIFWIEQNSRRVVKYSAKLTNGTTFIFQRKNV